MSQRNRPHRLLPALVLSALVAGLASPAHARPAAPRGDAPFREPLSALWAAVSRLWEGRAPLGQALRHLAGTEGASLDPHGGSPTGGTGGTAPTQGGH